jgi:hypothetical protein
MGGGLGGETASDDKSLLQAATASGKARRSAVGSRQHGTQC